MTSCDCGCCVGTQVETPVSVASPPGLPAIAYRVGDYPAFLSSMRARLSSPAYPALAGFTIRDTGDPGIAVLDGWAVVADVLTFYTERLVNEGYLRTATQQQSLRLLGRLVGYRPRPGLAADTYLSFTAEKDQSGNDTPVTIPAGTRAQSIPAPGQVAQPFESADDLVARSSWNDLQVLTRQPIQVTAAGLPKLPQISLAGTATNLKAGNRLLFAFGQEPGQQKLYTVSQVTVDQQANVTVAGQAPPEAPSLDALKHDYEKLLTSPGLDLGTMAQRSRIVARFEAEWLTVLNNQLREITTVGGFARRLDRLLERLDEAAALAAPYPAIERWFTQTLRPAIAGLRAQLDPLEPLPTAAPGTAGGGAAAQPAGALASGPALPLFLALGLDQTAQEAGGTRNGHHTVDPALLSLATIIGSLRRPPSSPPASSAALARDPAKLYAPGSDTGPHLLAALDPAIANQMYQAWSATDITQPQAAQEVQGLRVTASPFGATAPLQPQFDNDTGQLTGYTEWPLLVSIYPSVRVDFDSAGTGLVAANITLTSAGQVSQDLAAGHTSDHDLGPGHVRITVTDASVTPPAATFVFSGGLVNCTVTIAAPASVSGTLDVTVGDGTGTLQLSLAAGAQDTGTEGSINVTATRSNGMMIPTPSMAPSNPWAMVQLDGPEPQQSVLALDAVYDGVAPGMWVAVERPRKGATGPDSIPGDKALAHVFTRAKSARVVSLAEYGISGKATVLTLEHPWLDGQDTLLSDIRDATVYTGGEPLQLATEPVTSDVSGDQIELAQAYDGLTPGRWVVVAGERTDIPATTGVPAAELSMIAAVRQTVDPSRPGTPCTRCSRWPSRSPTPTSAPPCTYTPTLRTPPRARPGRRPSAAATPARPARRSPCSRPR